MLHTPKLQALQPIMTQAERDTGLDYILSVCEMVKTLHPSQGARLICFSPQHRRSGHLHDQPSTPLTVTLLLSFALLVSFIARAAVQAPVQKAPQQCLLLARQFCGRRGDKAAPVLLKAVLPLPAGWGRVQKTLVSGGSTREADLVLDICLNTYIAWLSLCVLENTHETGIGLRPQGQGINWRKNWERPGLGLGVSPALFWSAWGPGSLWELAGRPPLHRVQDAPNRDSARPECTAQSVFGQGQQTCPPGVRCREQQEGQSLCEAATPTRPFCC